jgi:pantetheine-phosphate adenylyltransferase
MSWVLQKMASEPLESLVACVAVSEPQAATCVSQVGAAGITPGHAPVSCTTTDGFSAGSQTLTAGGGGFPVTGFPPTGVPVAGAVVAGAPDTGSTDAGSEPLADAHPQRIKAAATQVEPRMCPQTGHAAGRMHARVKYWTQGGAGFAGNGRSAKARSTFDEQAGVPQSARVRRIALYPGSFDPPTNGHLSIIQRGLKMFDGLIVAILKNPAKDAVFSIEERVELLKGAARGDPRVEVKTFEGLLVNFAKQQGVNTVLRGLRAVSDFEYEFQMANMNRKLDKEIETLFMMTGEDYFYISSRFVRDVARLGGDVSGLVPPNVLEALKKRFSSK